MSEEKQEQTLEEYLLPKSAEDFTQKDVDWIIKRAISLQQKELTERTQQPSSGLEAKDALTLDTTPQPYSILRHAMTDTISSGEISQSYWNKAIEERQKDNASDVSGLEVAAAIGKDIRNVSRFIVNFSEYLLITPTAMIRKSEKNESSLMKIIAGLGHVAIIDMSLMALNTYSMLDKSHEHPSNLLWQIPLAYATTNIASGICEYAKYKARGIKSKKLEKLNGKKEE